MATQHDKQFKLDATRYYEDHKDLGLRGCVDGKIKYTNFGHEKYTTLRHKNWAALATKGTTFATKYTA